MPSPFRDNAQVRQSAEQESVNVADSCLTCLYCFEDTSEGVYYQQKKVLTWRCVKCGRINTVKDIDI